MEQFGEDLNTEGIGDGETEAEVSMAFGLLERRRMIEALLETNHQQVLYELWRRRTELKRDLVDIQAGLDGLGPIGDIVTETPEDLEQCQS